MLPSINSLEAFGIVQLEAMSYGIPVVSSNIPGVKSVITKTQNGYSFINKDDDDFLNKILLLKKKPMDPYKIQKNVNIYYNEKNFKNKVFNLFKFI